MLIRQPLVMKYSRNSKIPAKGMKMSLKYFYISCDLFFSDREKIILCSEVYHPVGNGRSRKADIAKRRLSCKFEGGTVLQNIDIPLLINYVYPAV